MSAVATETYRRLPGRGRPRNSLFTGEIQRLYLGSDHLLLVKTIYFTETYKRFYLNDIQAITIQKTMSGALTNITFGAISAGLAIALSGAAAAATSGGPGASGFGVLSLVLGIAFVGCAGYLILNTALGPTCNCHLWTAVHKEELQCLRRLRTARRVLDALIPIIESTQGGTVASPDVPSPAQSDMPFARTPRLGAATPTGARLDSGSAHALLFAALYADAGLGVLHLLFRGVMPFFIFVVSTLALFALAIWAVLRQRDTDMPGPLKTTTYWTIGYLCVIGMLLYYANFPTLMASDAGLPESDREVFEKMAAAMAIVARSFSVPGDLLLGTIGMVYYRQHRLRWARLSARHEEPGAEARP
jgi:hypothetical protein